MTTGTPTTLRTLAACALISAVCALIAVTPTTPAEALRCRATARIKLVPVDPANPSHLRGKASVISCSDGSSLLEVQVRAKGVDGATFIPALPSLNPLLGEWFYIANNRGEGFIQNVYAEQLHGRAIAVADFDFNAVLTGVFR